MLQDESADMKEVEGLLTQAWQGMMLSRDYRNELQAGRADHFLSSKGLQGEPQPLNEKQYSLWSQAVEGCEEAAPSWAAPGRGGRSSLLKAMYFSLRPPQQSLGQARHSGCEPGLKHRARPRQGVGIHTSANGTY